MRSTSLLFAFLFIVIVRPRAQDTVDVVEKNIKVSALSRETEYYGFAAGDKVIFSLTVDNGKELKDVTISEYPENVKFADHSTGKICAKVLNIARNGVYSFEYYNSSISGRVVNIKIQRVPKSDATIGFNTNVKWINKVDTTYVAREKRVLVSADTSFVDVLNATVQVHSQTNGQHSNRSLLSFILPANTVRWAYWIGVGQEGQDALRGLKSEIAAITGQALNTVNPLVGLLTKNLTLAHLNIGENVVYYFISSSSDAQLFEARQTFMQFKKGDVISDGGTITMNTIDARRLFIGLENDNILQGIDVDVKITAQVVNNRYENRIEMIPIVSNLLMPINERVD